MNRPGADIADKLAKGHYAPVIVRVISWPDGTRPEVTP